MKFERYPSAPSVAERAADLVAAVVEGQPQAVILLPAGGTPIPLYAELVGRARAGRLDLSATRLFQLDEIVGVAPGDPRGFQHFLRRHLLEPLGLEAHLLDGTATDPEREIGGHSRALAELGGADLALLGIGRNGHVAFNEPGTPPTAAGRRVELSRTTLDGLAPQFPEGTPRTGITLGLAEIKAARRVVLLATGASKAPVVARLATREVSDDLPASHLVPHPDFIILADEAAAGPPN